jgi:nitrous oxidase accessory protein
MLVPRAQHVDKDHARPSRTIDIVTIMLGKSQHFPFFVLFITIILVQIAYVLPIQSSTTTQLTYSPLSSIAVADTNFTVNVELRNAPLIRSFSISMVYNSTMVQANSVTMLIPWQSGVAINPNASTIKIDATTNNEQFLEGNQSLAAINLGAIMRGNTTIFYNGTEIRDSTWGVVPHENTTAQIEIIGHLSLTVATDELKYYLGSNATTYGNFTVDDISESAQIGIELRSQEGSKMIRSVSVGSAQPPTSWPIEVLSFYTSNEFGDPQNVFWAGFPAYVTVMIASHSNESLPIVLVINEFDKYNCPVGMTSGQGLIQPQTSNQTSILSLPLSNQYANGTMNAYLNILSDWPRNGGYPYCPEQLTSFQFSGGSTSPPPSYPSGNQTYVADYNLTFKLPDLNGLARWTVYTATLYKSKRLQAQTSLIAANLFVDDDGPADYSSIQAAINSAATRSTIYVYNGTYFENVNVNRTVYLVGESNAATTIDGGSLDTVVNITRGGVKLVNFKITNSSMVLDHNEGISVHGIVCTLTDNLITKTGTGIRVNGVNDTSISRNTIYDNAYGILLQNAGWTNMPDNTIVNSSSYGLYFNGTLCANSTFLQGVINNDNIGIQLSSATLVDISKTTITNNTYGVRFTQTTYSTISQSDISHNNQGITFSGSLCHNNSLLNSNVSLNIMGIVLDTSKDNRIIENDVMYNENFNLWIIDSDGNHIYHNNFIGESQAYVSALSNIFDDGYPSGGNYWSDYAGIDQHFGPGQDQNGSDGIGDTPYQVGMLNDDLYPFMRPSFEQDIGITDIFLSKDLVALNYTTRVFVRIVNYGSMKQSFNVTAYYNGTFLNSTTVVNMSGRSYSTVTLWWRPRGLWHGDHTHWIELGDYTISAAISILPNEANVTNNNYTGGIVRLRVFAGDFTDDGSVGPGDFAILSRFYGGTPAKPLWYPNADLIEDDKIGPGDFAVFASNFGKHV